MITAIARGAPRLRVRTIGRPSQPDLGNTSVGKPDYSGYCEDSAVPPDMEARLFYLNIVISTPRPAISFRNLR